MPLRGPYKQYEVDTTISVPRSTSHDRRKWRIVEVIDPVNSVEDDTELEYFECPDVQVRV